MHAYNRIRVIRIHAESLADASTGAHTSNEHDPLRKFREPAEGGFDCSGLTRAAYAAAGVEIPRTALTQHAAGPQIPPGQTLQPGDLIFYGASSTTIHHVGIYVGDGKMVHAPDVGDVVRIAEYRWPGDDFYAVTRPTAND